MWTLGQLCKVYGLRKRLQSRKLSYYLEVGQAWVVYELQSLCSGSLENLAGCQLLVKGIKGRSYRAVWVLLLKDLLKMDFFFLFSFGLEGVLEIDGSTFKTILTSNMVWNSLYRIGWVCNPASFRCWDYRHSYRVLFISILLTWFGLSHRTSYLYGGWELAIVAEWGFEFVILPLKLPWLGSQVCVIPQLAYL